MKLELYMRGGNVMDIFSMPVLIHHVSKSPIACSVYLMRFFPSDKNENPPNGAEKGETKSFPFLPPMIPNRYFLSLNKK
jgi:hypothetical protein